MAASYIQPGSGSLSGSGYAPHSIPDVTIKPFTSKDKEELKQDIMDRVNAFFEELDDKLKGINWNDIELE